MTVVLSDRGRAEVAGGAAAGALWLTAAELEACTGWALKPEGLCRDEVCVPVRGAVEALVVDGAVEAAGFWRHLGQPVVSTGDGSHWYLGEGAAARASRLTSLEAPDFTLPDKDGALHSLSDCRGKKVFLATWASW